ncbi:probable 3-beta-hydroxysteroid-Delta(8),Delta(7)-isomerase [Amaranthus tricolor]|uniref:probable 3-beta-hydroxysteroid-Delta(8),Delta(7)-isomerase n=1 Tax=Amaranthus tricolor TaxID=29722 RepID=UPI0025844517|nr:probable 3-beta-hydroxysteroid-Delta(8),Delta(7)-isomerase [Amaranthus tricolor]XP_057538538.1 probable 3-beta-hydroxysteroid-Delta(8),Delta(7)-isomerase [Amaranthus tricolor]
MEAHPYSPKDLILPGFVSNSMSALSILGVFAAASSIVLSVSWIFAGLFSKTTRLEKLLICWFTFTGLIHLIVEGYFAFTPDFIKDKNGFYLAEIWKEYSKGDSRYASFDSAIVAVEMVTAVAWGPACLLVAYAIAAHKSYRYVLQLIISLGQFYGLVIYYITAVLEGDHFSTSPLYYYAYYIGANSPWGLIPFLIIIRCWRKICESERRNKRKVQ